MVTAKTITDTKKAPAKAAEIKAVEDAEIEVEASEEEVEMGEEKEAKPSDPNVIKKKEIYEHVSVSTGLRKRDVREAVDSLLEFWHTCLTDGKTIQVPPLGKIRTIERGTGDNIKLHYKLTLKKDNDAEKKDV